MLTRRRFLECAAGAAGGALAIALPRELSALEAVERGSRRAEGSVRCVLLDLGGGCSLRESLAGYESALEMLGVSWARLTADSLPRCELLIVPAALCISASIARQLSARARDGATVVLESGAGFAGEDEPDFLAHRDVLREELRLHVEAPVPLWPRSAASRGVPYVEYSWPSAASVRDFSRVVPLGSATPGDEVIARSGGLPVASRRRIGSGTLVYLGSPLGPTLRAGDAEATRWLAAVTAVSRQRSR